MNEITQIDYEKAGIILTKVDRILTGNTKILIQNRNKAVGDFSAYTDLRKSSIVINTQKLRKMRGINYNLYKGLNYHELAHIIHTKISLQKTHAKQELNLLEDSKIESLFTNEFPKSEKYFRVNVLKLMDNKKASNYLLMYGRRAFLDKDLIKNYGLLFEKKYNKNVKKEAEKIIDTYILNKSLPQSYKLAEAFKKLMEDNSMSTPESSEQSSLSKNSSAKKVDKKTDKEIDNLKEKLKEVDSKDSKDNKDSKDKKKELTQKDSKETIKKEIEKQMKSELKEKTEAMDLENMDEIKSIGQGEKDYDGNFEYNPDNTEGEKIRKLTKTLKKIKNDLANGYQRKKKRGRLDIRQIIQNQARDRIDSKVFKKFLPDKKNLTNLGVTIQVDSSGSVSDIDYRKELSIAYIISKSLENTKSKVAIYEFSNRFKLIKDFEKNKGLWDRTFNGGTTPSHALKDSYNKLMILKKKGHNTLINFLITDGGFYSGNNEIKLMNKAGIITVLINVCGYRSSEKHHCKHLFNIRNMNKDLLPKMEELIIDLQTKIKNNVLESRRHIV